MDYDFVNLDRVNQAITDYHKAHGKAGSLLILSQIGWTQLNTCAWCGQLTRGYAQSEEYKAYIKEINHYYDLGYSQVETEIARKGGIWDGFKVYIDPLPNAPLIRVE